MNKRLTVMCLVKQSNKGQKGEKHTHTKNNNKKQKKQKKKNEGIKPTFFMVLIIEKNVSANAKTVTHKIKVKRNSTYFTSSIDDSNMQETRIRKSEKRTQFEPLLLKY